MKMKLLFQVLFFVAAMFIIQSCADELEIQPDLEITDIENVEHRYATGPGTPWDELSTCYYGGISVDYDCDGSFEVGWNHSASSASACQAQTAQKIATANSNGWCYETRDNDCQAHPCYVLGD